MGARLVVGVGEHGDEQINHRDVREEDEEPENREQRAAVLVVVVLRDAKVAVDGPHREERVLPIGASLFSKDGIGRALVRETDHEEDATERDDRQPEDLPKGDQVGCHPFHRHGEHADVRVGDGDVLEEQRREEVHREERVDGLECEIGLDEHDPDQREECLRQVRVRVRDGTTCSCDGHVTRHGTMRRPRDRRATVTLQAYDSV